MKTKEMIQKKSFSSVLLVATILISLLAGFSSCCDDDDPMSDYVYYMADCTLSSTGSIGPLFVIAEYTSAIEEVMGEEYKEADSQVIAACDAVYAFQRAKYSNVKGEVTITKKWLKNDKKSTVIKTYKYE